jgi:hypothetical protein
MKHFVWVGLVIASQAFCEQMQHWKGYDIHYSTFSSKLVPIEVANAHDIIRADNRLITNISIRRKGAPVRANVHGTVRNLLDQQVELEFTEVTERQAIYYLATQIVNAKDTISFRIFIRPERENKTYQLEFTRQYY